MRAHAAGGDVLVAPDQVLQGLGGRGQKEVPSQEAAKGCNGIWTEATVWLGHASSRKIGEESMTYR